jgi:hypothetical protein
MKEIDMDTTTAEMRTIEDVIGQTAGPEDDTREHADWRDVQLETDGAFQLFLDDGSHVDATQISVDGSVVGLGRLDGSGWGEVALSWAALQVLADEINAQLRQARVNGWL